MCELISTAYFHKSLNVGRADPKWREKDIPLLARTWSFICRGKAGRLVQIPEPVRRRGS